MSTREPKTYEEYLAYSQAMQRKYITDERNRNNKLLKLWYDYKAKASKLGFHALDRSEIVARFDQLRVMEARIPDTHGDSPRQLALWEMHQSEAGSKVP